MKVMKFGGALALSLLLVACGEKPNASIENREGPDANLAASQTSGIYSGTGELTAIAGDKVTIAHGPIEGIGWPAMTMTFVAEPGQLAGLSKGDQVAFAFRQQDGQSVISSISKP